MNDNMELNPDSHIQDEAERLFKEMKLMKQNVKNSEFYAGMLLDLEKINPHLVLLEVGLYSKAKVVIYGLGSIEFSYNSQFQLAVVLLLKDHVEWIGKIEIFDPVMTTADIKVFKKFGLEVLTNDENCKRKVQGPTMFYMPSPCFNLLGNLLGANWSSSSLDQIFLLTNSLRATRMNLPLWDPFTLETKLRLAIIHEFTAEISINTNDHQMYASFFHDFAWHFFKVNEELREYDWLYTQRYLEIVFSEDFKRNKTSKEFAQNLGSIRGPRQFRNCSVPHQVGWFKLNIYGIGSKEGDQSGRFSGVLKDKEGELLDGYCYRVEFDDEDDVIVGLEALKYGLTRIKKEKLKVEKLMVESDNAMLVQYVNGRPEPNETTMAKLNEIFKLLEGITWIVYHVYEETNKVAIEGVPRDERKLYLENVPFDIPESGIEEVFAGFGKVEDVQLLKDPETGHRNGCGFVKFAQVKHAKQAQEILKGELKSKHLCLKISPAPEHVGVQDAGA
ncbi:hypothetical protein KY284_007464 [Solanum tuberosum]|nr:hypothetical protein KY284_007464 [Solanum tuberosum]